jgi:hypothetical protein
MHLMVVFTPDVDDEVKAATIADGSGYKRALAFSAEEVQAAAAAVATTATSDCRYEFDVRL